MPTTIVLVRHDGYQFDGVTFVKGVPVEVDDSVARRLLETGAFQLPCALPPRTDIPEGFDISGTQSAQPLNSLTDQDLNGKRILLRRNGGIGDIVFVATFAHWLKEQYASLYVALAVRDEFMDFADSFDAVDAVLSLQESSTEACYQYDYVIHFNGVIEERRIDDLDYFTAHWERAGLQFNTDTVFSPLRVSLKLVSNASVQRAADRVLHDLGITNEPYIAVVLGTSNPLKTWDNRVLTRIVNGLATDAQGERRHVLCVGSTRDRLPDTPNEWVHCATEQDLRTSAELLRRAGCVLGGDTGLVQFAAAVNVPTIALFGPTDPALSLDHYAGSVAVFAPTGVDCSPCKRLRMAFCSRLNGTVPDCMLRVETDPIVKLAKESFSLEHVKSAGLPVAPAQDFNIAILIDNGDTYTGGGMYAWSVAKALGRMKRFRINVTVYTDTPNFVYANDRDHVKRVSVMSLTREQLYAFEKHVSAPYDLIIGTPPFCGAPAKRAAAACGAQLGLFVYETPNYVQAHRPDAVDAKESYWAEYKDALEAADVAICCSHPVREALKAWIPNIAALQLLCPVPNMADYTHVYEEGYDKTNSVVLIARNVPYKRLEPTLQLLAENILSTRGDTPWDVHVIGSGTEALKDSVKASWADKGVRVQLHGQVSEDAKWRMLIQAKALVFPSEFEGFGIPVMEAMIARTPVVAHPLPVFKKHFKTLNYYTTEEEFAPVLNGVLERWRTPDEKWSKELDTLHRRAVYNFFAFGQVGKFVSDFCAPRLRTKESPHIEVNGENVRVAIVTPWNVRCGIAETTRTVTREFNVNFRILAPVEHATTPMVAKDEQYVSRCWPRMFVDTRHLLSDIETYKPHVVHIHHEFSFFHKNPTEERTFFAAVEEIKKLGAKVVLTLHTVTPSGLLDKLIAAVDAATAGKPIPEYVDKLHAIGLPVDPPASLPSVECRRKIDMHDGVDRYVVGSCGFWNPHKGYREFLQTFDDVSVRAQREVRYVLSGARDTKNSYCSEVLRENLDKLKSGVIRVNQQFVGAEELRTWLGACDTLVYYYNVLGHISASAALRTGISACRPIICTHSSMFSEFVHETHVLKVPFGDRNALIAAILRLENDKALRDLLVQNCVKFAIENSPAATARAYEALYKRVLGE